MPLRMMLANPFALAVMTAFAIGIITYQILNNKKRVPTRARYRGIDYGSDRPDKPDESPRGFGKGDDGGKGTANACNETKSEKSSNASSGVRKRTVATQNADTSKISNLEGNCSESQSHSHSVSNSIDENPDLASDSSINLESQYPSQQNSEMQKVENNISEVNCNKTFLANINDADSDSDSSESNNLQVHLKKTFVANIDEEDSDSSDSNNSLKNHNKSMDLDESICNVASTSRSKNIRTLSPIDNFEEIYKRDVCSHLKTDIDGENYEEIYKRDVCSHLETDIDGENYEEEKCLKNFSDEESDVSENNFSAISEDSNASCTIMKKPDKCKGCLEEFANAVAYPCKHCYLCLDCAVKVHRIFKKCSICFSVIKTFEQLKV